MKKIFGIGIVTSMILIGCGQEPMQPEQQYIAPKPKVTQPTSVVQMMGNTEVVGWENYRDDSDQDGVPDYRDKCPNTPPNVPVNKSGCPLDSDHDGVDDYKDECPNTPQGVVVNAQGCPVDSDHDGVPDTKDKCPNTPKGLEVDRYGCALDTDGDGIPNFLDQCSNTPIGAIVDDRGCSLDGDKDGVPDGIDKCPNTPAGAKVDKYGCAIDSDHDGIPDIEDKCPNTPKGTKVDKTGCPVDTDHDGVPDVKDKCPNTPSGMKVNFQGCPVLAEYRFNFKFNSSKISKNYYPQIKKLAEVLKSNKNIKIEIQGFTDNVGSYVYNKELSLKRANSLREILIKKFKISPNRITIIGYGSDYPVASNATPEGKAENRRIVVIAKEGSFSQIMNGTTSNIDAIQNSRSENIPPKKIDE